MKKVQFAKGDVVFREFEAGGSMYKILAGGAAVYADYAGPEQKLLTELKPGDYFGEMAAIDACPRSATVVVSEDGTLLREIEAEDLSAYLAEYPEELDGIAAHLSRRLRELTADYTEVCDTLRELGRLDTSVDRISDSLFTRIRKFAAVYLRGKKAAEQSAEAPRAAADAVSHADGYAMHRRTFDRGEVIFREGERSDCMYDIDAGRVGIYADYGTQRQKLLAELVPNMFFGEMGLFGGKTRSAAAVALEDGTCVEQIFERELPELYAKNSVKVLLILGHLSSRLRQLTNDYLRSCKALADAQGELEAGRQMTAETRMQLEYMNQLLLMPEVLY